MKLPIIILAVFGFAYGKSVTGSHNLQDDFNDFLALIPIDQIHSIVMDYIANNDEIQEFVSYIQSADFQKIITTVEGLPEFKNFMGFLGEHGLDVAETISTVNSFLGLPPSSQSRSARRELPNFFHDIIAVLPADKLKALFYEKLQTSPDFKEFYDAIRSPEFQSIISALNAMPEYQVLLKKLEYYGFDVEQYIQLIRSLFGITPDARNLQDDLDDFLALIPVDQIRSIVIDYLANDAEVQELVAYLQSAEFHKIVTTIFGLDEFKNFYDFLYEHGVDITNIINSFYPLTPLPPYTQCRRARRGVGVSGLIEDVVAILPVTDLKALFDEKLQSSPDFKELYDAVQSPEFQTIIQTLDAMCQNTSYSCSYGYGVGVDVDHFIDIVRALFGLS